MKFRGRRSSVRPKMLLRSWWAVTRSGLGPNGVTTGGGGAVNGFKGPNGGLGRVRALRATPGGRVRIVLSKKGLSSESRGPL